VALFVCLFLAFLFLFSFLSCYQTAEHSPESIWEDDAKVTAYLDALPIHLPDTCVLRIREALESEWAQQKTRLAEAEKQRKTAHLETLAAILLLLLALVVVFWTFVR